MGQNISREILKDFEVSGKKIQLLKICGMQQNQYLKEMHSIEYIY